jgi:hypothetical protein
MTGWEVRGREWGRCGSLAQTWNYTGWAFVVAVQETIAQVSISPLYIPYIFIIIP